jgi:hypothetical protein
MAVSVTPQDIENVWRPLSSEQSAIVPGLSGSAWRRLLRRAPWVDAEGFPVDDVKDVMVSMILRVLKNPDSVRTLSESIDDYTEAKTLDAAISSGELYVTDYEVSLLAPKTEAPDYGMYVVGLGG